MRNTGWYIPYWRKSRKKGKSEKPSSEEITRSDEQLEAVRRRWVERYRRTMRALGAMGLSMGSTRGDVQTRYNALRAAGTEPSRELEDAYHYLLRTLLPPERRKKRTPAGRAPSVGTQAGAILSGTDEADSLAFLDEEEGADGDESSDEEVYDVSDDEGAAG